MATTYAQTGTPDSTVQDLEQKLNDSKAIRRPREPHWLLNLAYLDGQQWVGFDGLQLFEAKLEEWRAKCVDNRIRSSARSEIARMTKSQPVWVGVPKDGSDKEVAAARMRERVFDHYWSVRLDLVRKLRAALLWRTATAGFWKVYWDPNKGGKTRVLVGPDGQVLKNPQTGAPVPAEMLEQLPPELAAGAQVREVGMGDVCIEVRSPFELYPDDLAGEEGLESAEWIVEDSVYSPGDVKDWFGVDLEPDARASMGITEARMPAGVSLGINDGRKTGVRVREFWAKPGSAYGQKGKRVVWAQGRVLYEDANPYPWLPYVMFAGQPFPGRFWPAGTVDDMISPQTSLNKRESQIEENADRIGNPPLLRSAHNEDVEWHGLPGEEIVFQDTGTPGAIPQFLDVPELPVYVREDVDRKIQSIREISNHPEISSGAVPAGVTAAAAISQLLEGTDTVLGPDIGDMNEAITGAGRRLLWMLKQWGSDERLAKIAGEEGQWDLVAFKGNDLSDAEEDGVQVGSGLPQSRAAKQAAIQEVLNMLAQSGMPLNERDLRRVLQEYEVGGLEKFFATIGVNERQVARENFQLAGGAQQLSVNSYDEDEIHIAGHQEFQKSARYDELPDPVKKGFEDHVAAHIQRQQQAAEQQAAQQLQQAQQEELLRAQARASVQPAGGGGG